MAFLQVAGAARSGDVHELLAAHVFEQPVRQQHRVVGRAGAEVHVEIAVVVEVREVAAHDRQGMVESDLLGHVLEALPVDVPIEPGGHALVG